MSQGVNHKVTRQEGLRMNSGRTRWTVLWTVLFTALGVVVGSTSARPATAQSIASDPEGSPRIVPVHQEPRHRLIYESSQMRVLDVQIQPGDTTIFHTHDSPITYVTIGTSTTDARTLGGDWRGTVQRDPPPGRIGAVRGVPSYAERPVTHRVTNVGTTLFRLIAIATRSSGHETDLESESAMPGQPEGTPNRWFRYSRVMLGPGETAEATAPAFPVAIVMTREGRVRVEHWDGWTTSLEVPGQVRVIDANADYRLVNASRAERAEIVLVEVR
jgi:hypothetical protein